jgi:4-amino-4-deoxy-L-arabinose transferase-like glycosyltransferase
MTGLERSTPPQLEGSSAKPFWVTALWLFLAALIARLAFLPLTNNNGTDAWTRYTIALSWLKNPSQLPSSVWLPLHFWLLGSALYFWSSEWCARLFTMLLSTLTILPYWGTMRRVFDLRVAFWSALLFALFGFHIAYSVTTSSEGPTIFFLVVGFYGWVRLRLGDGWIWLLPSGLALSAASLCRFEVWVVLPVLAFFLLDFSQGWTSLWRNRRAWAQAVSFALAASAGAIGWMLYSFSKWGDPLAAAKGSAWQSQHMLLHQSLFYRLVAIPGALVVTLSPLIAGLAVWGILELRVRSQPVRQTLAVVALSMIGFQVFNSVTSNLTMARFTLMYSWLLIPFAFDGLFRLAQRWPDLASRFALSSTLLFFLLWQVGTTLGAYFAPPAIAAKLSSVAATLPLDPELRNLTRWLQINRKPGEAVVVDQYLFEAVDIARYSGIPFSEFLAAPVPPDGSLSDLKVVEFISQRHPRFLVYCPSGMLGRVWSLGDREETKLPPLPQLELHRLWQGERYRVYEIEFLH